METIKEEKKADLEQLLNSLIEKGWDVFPDKKFFGNKDKLRFSKGKKCVWFGNDDYTLREIVSKESGLWQFVCENKLITNSIKMREAREHDIDDYSNILIMYDPYEYQYRLIESSLKDESELEDFLLNSISLQE